MAKDYQYSGWWARPAAVFYVATVGLVVGIALMIIGSLYGIVGTVFRLLRVGDHKAMDTWTRRPIAGPVADTMRWWGALLYYAVTGRGEFKLTPDMDI